MFASRNGKGYIYGLMLCTIFFVHSVFSQSYKKQTANNTIYFEAFGSAPIGNLSYGRQIFLSKKNKLSLDLGIQYAPFVSTRWSMGASPQISYLYGSTNHIELGIGCFYDFYWGDLIPFPKLGYRYQKKDGGLMVKIECTPMLVVITQSKTIFPWGGIGLGWAF
jgi:hypothetical protein